MILWYQPYVVAVTVDVPEWKQDANISDSKGWLLETNWLFSACDTMPGYLGNFCLFIRFVCLLALFCFPGKSLAMLGESRMSPRASSGTYVSNSPADKRWCGRLPGHPGGCQFLLHFGAYAKDFNAKWWQAFFPAFLPSVSLASTTDSCIASFQAADWCTTGRWCWWIDCIAWKRGHFCFSLKCLFNITIFFREYSTSIYWMILISLSWMDTPERKQNILLGQLSSNLHVDLERNQWG